MQIRTTNSSDEVGELLSIAVAVKIPAAQVPPNSDVIIPLGPPDIGIEADMLFLSTTLFIFLRLHGIPQPLLSYGACYALSERAEEFDIPAGSLFKFPSVTHYVVARPTVAASLIVFSHDCS